VYSPIAKQSRDEDCQTLTVFRVRKICFLTINTYKTSPGMRTSKKKKARLPCQHLEKTQKTDMTWNETKEKAKQQKRNETVCFNLCSN